MRRKKKQGFEFWHIVTLFLIAILAYVWQQGLIVNQGYRIGTAEIRYKELLTENRQLQAQALSLKSTSAIRSRLQKFGLPLVEPKSWNVYRFDFNKVK
ncbi:MAG: hypothetical protein WC081_05785 [Candidatus Ratteibacteria bacterium]|jgi:hypothetical protein